MSVLERGKVTKAMLEHGLAFARCIERSDLFLRKYLNSKEVATIVAENVDGKESFLRNVTDQWKKMPEFLSGSMCEKTEFQKINSLGPEDILFYISNNTVDSIHFLPKSGAKLLQLADICAFSFRRYLSKMKNGRDLCLAMLGSQGPSFVSDPVWFSGGSSGLFNTHKYSDGNLIRVPLEYFGLDFH